MYPHGNRATSDPLRQILAVDELHDEGAHTVGFFQAVDLRDVCVVQRGERLRFACEPRQAIRIASDGVGQDLQGHIAIEPRVVGPKHLPHAAFADLGGGFIDAEPGAGTERHLLRGLYGRARAGGNYS